MWEKWGTDYAYDYSIKQLSGVKTHYNWYKQDDLEWFGTSYKLDGDSITVLNQTRAVFTNAPSDWPNTPLATSFAIGKYVEMGENYSDNIYVEMMKVTEVEEPGTGNWRLKGYYYYVEEGDRYLVQGNYRYSDVKSTNRNAYPNNGTDGDYWYIYIGSTNVAPTTPSSITVPSTLKEDVTATISWGTSNDTDGNLSGYILEQRINSGSWTQVYKGSATSYQITPQASWNTVAYRVKAYDTENAMSTYKTSATVTVQHNSAPTMPKYCSIPNPVKGGTSIKITWPASTDPDGNLSGYILERKFDSNSWTQVYKGPNRSYIDPIPLDKYKRVTYRVKVYDTENVQSSYATSVTRTIQNSTVLQFRLKTPIKSTKRAAYGQEIMTYTIPSGATFKVEACNNGFDETPTWENVTELVKKQKIFPLNNKSKTSSKWGYDIRVTVDRNGATGDCYFTKGNGFFEETDEIDPPDPNKLPDAGGTFTCFGIEWLVLHNYNNEVLCITKDIIDLSVFGPTTYGYNRSTLRANCLSFGRQINISSSDFIMIDPHGQYTDEIFIPHQTILTSGHFDDEKNRIAYYNGSAGWYWTSTLQKISQDEYGNPLAITQSGTITNSANPSIPCGMRPCIYIDQSKYKSE